MCRLQRLDRYRRYLTGPVFAMSYDDMVTYRTQWADGRRSKRAAKPTVKRLWSKQVGAIWTMALAGDRLVVAGPVVEDERQDLLKAKGRL